MLRYLLRRLGYAVLILLGVAVLTFVLFYKVQSKQSIARRNLGKNPTPQQIQLWLDQHGYNQPEHVLLLRNIKELFTLQFGRSDQNNEEISKRIQQGAGPSAAVASVIFIGSLIGSITFALGMAYFRGTYLDYWGTFLCVLLMSVVYMVYIISGQFLMGKVLRYYPLTGWGAGLDMWKFVWLPAMVGIFSGFASSARLYRTFMLEEVSQDYVRTARAKGVPESAVLLRHVLKNSAIPILTSVVATIPLLFTGSILLESFFGIPGLGSYLVDGINSQDFAVVRAMVFVATIFTIIGLILTDVSYALVDPRVRLE
jgi:peptide/nickel transport system permease protein